MRRYRSDVDDLDLDLIEWGLAGDDGDEETAVELALSLLGYDPREGGDDE